MYTKTGWTWQFLVRDPCGDTVDLSDVSPSAVSRRGGDASSFIIWKETPASPIFP
jgi:hypothetical protein